MHLLGAHAIASHSWATSSPLLPAPRYLLQQGKCLTPGLSRGCRGRSQAPPLCPSHCSGFTGLRRRREHGSGLCLRRFGRVLCRGIDTDQQAGQSGANEGSVGVSMQDEEALLSGDEKRAKKGTGWELPVLFLVPIAWGTWGPAGRLVFELPSPPSPLVFNFSIQIVSTTLLLTAVLISSQLSSRNAATDKRVEKQTSQPPDFRKIVRAGLELGGLLFLGKHFVTSGRQLSHRFKPDRNRHSLEI